MSFENYKIFFFLIHLINLIALFIHIGMKKDGFDVKIKRLTNQGKLATGIVSVSIIGFIFFVYHYHNLCNLSSLYLGYGITTAIFSIPFITTCHNKMSKQAINLNFAGFVALLVGFSGFLTSFMWFFDLNQEQGVATDVIDNYISILGQFIAGTSALIAFSGTTIETKLEKNDKGKPFEITRLTDLGKVAITVIVLGFAVSIIDFNLDNAEKKRVNLEVDEIHQQAQSIAKNLDAANVFLTDSLMPQTDQWLAKLNENYNEIEDLDEKIMQVQKDLQLVAKTDQINTLQQKLKGYGSTVARIQRQLKGVAKQTDTQGINIQLSGLESKLTTLQNQLKLLAKSTELEKVKTAQRQEISQLKQSLASYKAQMNQLQKQMNQLATKSDVEALKQQLVKNE